MPFHFWSLDVYNSLISETLFFFIIINKLVLIYAFFRTFCCLLNLNFKILIFLQPFLFFICVVSIFIGSIGAFNEHNFNRFLVLSSLPQVSYVLIGFFTFNKDIVICAVAYFLFYIFTLFIIFLVVLTFEKAFYMPINKTYESTHQRRFQRTASQIWMENDSQWSAFWYYIAGLFIFL